MKRGRGNPAPTGLLCTEPPPGVASLARMWTNNGTFTNVPDIYGVPATNPTLATVEHWLVSLSAAVDTALNNQGFQTPVTNVTVLEDLDLLVEQMVADLVHAANSSGRFFTDRAIERGTNPISAVRGEIATYVNEHTTGFEVAGVPRLPDTSGEGEAIFDVL